MASPETKEFFRVATRHLDPCLMSGQILEIGSYDVNGSVRGFFPDANSYVGVDICEGPGVDVVAFGNELELPDGAFNIGISSSALEHDPNFRATFANLVRMTKKGGAVIVAVAGPGFPEHGTTRTGAVLSPGTSSVGSEYYRNVSESDLLESVDFAAEFSSWRFWYLKGTWDLFLIAYRRDDDAVQQRVHSMPADIEVLSIADVTPLVHRIVRLPFRVMHRVLPESTHSAIAGRIWFRLARIQERFLGNRFVR